MPSKKILEQKQQAVKELAEKLRAGKAGVLVNYQGITVEADTQLRKEFRAAGVEYMVMKNTLVGRACDEAGLSELKEQLQGMTAIAICTEDPLAPAKIAKKFADKLNSFTVKAGYIDGAVIDAAKVNELADIPSKEILLARLLGSLTGPLQSLAFALQSVVDKNGETAEAAPAEA